MTTEIRRFPEEELPFIESMSAGFLARPDVGTRPTKESPDLTLHVSALGAAYLGGTPLRGAAIERGADEHRSEALAQTDALLRTLDEPWCSTFF